MIVGWFDPSNQNYPLPFVRAAIYLPGLTLGWTPIPFLVDTGAGATSIHTNDATDLLELDRGGLAAPSEWDRHERHTGVGGVGLYYIVAARYGFQNAHHDWELFDADIRIASLSPDSPGIPSVLGWDVLRRFVVHLDWSQKMVELQ